jgi:hypothetical protein
MSSDVEDAVGSIGSNSDFFYARTDDRHGFEVSGGGALDGSKLKSSFTTGFWREVEQVVS